jgi:heme A synthase
VAAFALLVAEIVAGVQDQNQQACASVVCPMIVLVFATLVGGTATFVALLPYGVLIALMAAPFGGSMSCIIAAAVLYALRSNQSKPNGRGAP